MAGRGQIADGSETQYGLPTGPGTGLTQQQFGDRYAPELFNDYGSGSFPSGVGRGQYQNNDPSNPFNDRFVTPSLQGGEGADNLYNYLYGNTGRNFSEGDTIPQQNGPNIPGDDWMTPLPQPQDPVRYGGGRNSVFAPNSLYQSPENPSAEADPQDINYTGEMRDYTGQDPIKSDSLGPTQQTPYYDESKPDSRYGFDTATPSWQDYVSPDATQNYSNQYDGWNANQNTQSEEVDRAPLRITVNPEYDLGDQDTVQPSGDTNQPQDYTQNTLTEQPAQQDTVTQQPVQQDTTTYSPTYDDTSTTSGYDTSYTVPNRINSLSGVNDTGFDATSTNVTGLPYNDIHGSYSRADSSDYSPQSRRGGFSQTYRDQVAAILAARGY